MSLDHPVRMMTASPGRSVWPAIASAPRRSSGNAVRGREHVDALEPRHIDQYATGYQAADILDPELFESRASADVAQLEAIVEAVAPHLMSECVELGADLAKLGDDKLLVDLAGVGYWRRRLGVDVEYAASIDEDLLGIRRQHRPELK